MHSIAAFETRHELGKIANCDGPRRTTSSTIDEFRGGTRDHGRQPETLLGY